MMEAISEDKVKGMLITKTAIKTLRSQELIEKIINFQFKDANANIRTCNEIEFSGLGKIMISKTKLKSQISKMKNSIAKFQRELEDPTLPDRGKEIRNKRIKDCSEALTFLLGKNQKYEN